MSTASIHVNGFNTCQWLQYKSIASIHDNGFNTCQQLQYMSMTSIHVNVPLDLSL